MEPFDSIYPKLSNSYFNSKRNKIEHFFNKNWPSKNNNISFLVAKDGQVIYENYVGFGDIKKKTPITSKTPIHIASVSKVLTATAILKLVNAGKLGLNQKVNTVLKCDNFFKKKKIEGITIPKYKEWIKIYNFQ